MEQPRPRTVRVRFAEPLVTAVYVYEPFIWEAPPQVIGLWAPVDLDELADAAEAELAECGDESDESEEESEEEDSGSDNDLIAKFRSLFG